MTILKKLDPKMQHSANQPDLIIKIDEKCYIVVKLFHNPYFNKQLGKQENDMQPAWSWSYATS